MLNDALNKKSKYINQNNDTDIFFPNDMAKE
jgi:hypothetical protein